MKFKALFPWICVAVLGIGLAITYSNSQSQSTELTKLREESQELQKLRASAEETKSSQAQAENEELTRLRKEHEDLLRVRNEVRQLRDEKATLAKQLQSAQAQVQSTQTQGKPGFTQSGVPIAANPGTPLVSPDQQASLDALRARYGLAATQGTSPDQLKATTCQIILRQIEAAKAQWATDKGRPAGGLVGETDIAAYMPGGNMLKCPGGGIYTLNPIGQTPLCSIPGHSLPK